MRIRYIKEADGSYLSSKSYYGDAYKEYVIRLAPDRMTGKIINRRTEEVVYDVGGSTSPHKLLMKVKRLLLSLGVADDVKETREKRNADT